MKKIKLGQVYVSNDKSKPIRYIKIIEIDQFRVRYFNLETNKRIWIDKKRIGNKRLCCFSLHTDVN